MVLINKHEDQKIPDAADISCVSCESCVSGVSGVSGVLTESATSSSTDNIKNGLDMDITNGTLFAIFHETLS